VTLDYGRNVEGLPTFEVVSRTGDTSGFEMSYADSSELVHGEKRRLKSFLLALTKFISLI
jgi:hypothetical protein